MDYVYHSLFSDVEITETEFRSELEQLGIDGKHPLAGLKLDEQVIRVLEKFDGTEYWRLHGWNFQESVYNATGITKDYLSRLRSSVGAKRRAEVSTSNFSKLIDACLTELDKAFPNSAAKWDQHPSANKRQWVACTLCGKLTPDARKKLKSRYLKERSNDKRKLQVFVTSAIASILTPDDLQHLYGAAMRAALGHYSLPALWVSDDVHILKEYAIGKRLMEDPADKFKEPLSKDDEQAVLDELEQIRPEDYLALLRVAIKSEDPLLAEFCLNALPDPVLQTQN